MTWNKHPTINFGDLWSATQQNTYVKGNLDHIANTRFIPLSILEAAEPSGITSAARDYLTSSSTDTLVPSWPVLRFDALTDEGRMWTFKIPPDYGGTMEVKLTAHMDSASTDDYVRFGVYCAVQNIDDTGVEAKSFGTLILNVVPVPAAADKLFEIHIIDVANVYTEIVAGSVITMLLVREGTSVVDTAGSDAIISSVEIVYTMEVAV